MNSKSKQTEKEFIYYLFRNTYYRIGDKVKIIGTNETGVITKINGFDNQEKPVNVTLDIDKKPFSSVMLKKTL